MLAKYALAVEVNTLSLKPVFFFPTGHMTLDKVVIFIFSYQKNIGIMIPGTLVFCKEKGSTLSTFSEL